MTDPFPAQTSVEPQPFTWQSFLLGQLPYIAVLVLTLFGVAYTSMAQEPLVLFWEILAVAMGALCIAAGWSKHPDKSGRFELIWKQVLHWAAILIAMNIALLPSAQKMLTAPATGLTILLLLALGTFLAGINTSLKIAFLGMVMALAVPAIVWLKLSTLFLFLFAAAGIGIGLVLWRR
jgi:hypothetical protein